MKSIKLLRWTTCFGLQYVKYTSNCQLLTSFRRKMGHVGRWTRNNFTVHYIFVKYFELMANEILHVGPQALWSLLQSYCSAMY